MSEENVHFVCNLNRKLYSVITPNITTDEVIITEERLAHIRERHPRDYEHFLLYGNRLINDPDYIMEANLPFSSLNLLEVEESGDKVYLILRLHTQKDLPSRKNSVITFMRIKDKEWRRMLRNKKMLYKKPKLD